MTIRKLLPFAALVALSAGCNRKPAESPHEPAATVQSATSGTTATETGGGTPISTTGGDTRPRVTTTSTTTSTTSTTTR